MWLLLISILQVEAEVRRHLEFEDGHDQVSAVNERSGPLGTEEVLEKLRQWKV